MIYTFPLRVTVHLTPQAFEEYQDILGDPDRNTFDALTIISGAICDAAEASLAEFPIALPHARVGNYTIIDGSAILQSFERQVLFDFDSVDLPPDDLAMMILKWNARPLSPK